MRIDNRAFFKERDFPIFEFILFIDEWIKKSGEQMIYNRVESDNNPLILFTKSMKDGE